MQKKKISHSNWTKTLFSANIKSFKKERHHQWKEMHHYRFDCVAIHDYINVNIASVSFSIAFLNSINSTIIFSIKFLSVLFLQTFYLCLYRIQKNIYIIQHISYNDIIILQVENISRWTTTMYLLLLSIKISATMVYSKLLNSINNIW